MSLLTENPFIIGGLAILGLISGYSTNKLRLKPLFAGILAWTIQTPYVFITDYIWFTLVNAIPPPVALSTVTIVLLMLTVEALIASGLAATIISYIKHS